MAIQVTGQSFAADISRFVDKTKLSGAIVLKNLSFTAYGMLIRRSPVDTGRFRASWRIAVNRINTSVEPERSRQGSGTKGHTPPSGAETVQASAALSAVKWEDTIAITNNLPYAKALEDGSSTQAPNGVLRVTFEQLENELNRITRALK